jgi:glycosyltransferase involved in cell wall biosynthesis
MNILHLYSDWKWTGPAEPAIQTCRSLMDAGHRVVFACSEPPPDYPEHIKGKAQELGLDLDTRFALDRHCPPLKTLKDLFTLPVYIRRGKFDVVHVHLSHDHSFGSICARLGGPGRPVIVRSLYKRRVLENDILGRIQLKHLADGFVTFTPSFRQEYIERFDLNPDRVVVSPMPVDIERFNPNRRGKTLREEFKIAPDTPVIGIVGRWQKYRKADVFLEAAKKVAAKHPETRFMIVGRSSQIQQTVVEPMKELGLENNVILTGYRMDDYVETLATMDVFSLLMPGFDGTARAVREAMALGIPCVVSDYGMLPEIVPDQQAGRVVPINPENLAEAWLELIESPDKRTRMGTFARRFAEKKFRIDQLAETILPLYERLLQANV